MKRLLTIFLTAAILCGCTAQPSTDAPDTGAADGATTQTVVADQTAIITPGSDETPFVSRFQSENTIVLSDSGITMNGEALGGEGSVYLSNDIIYYEDKDTYDSGYPYGNGGEKDKHTADEAAAHTVVNITEPGAYRISGTLSAGQIRVDLGEDAYGDESAVVELILDGVEISCSVAPAVVFMNVYECDGAWSVETASADVDTSAAGAVISLAEGSRNTINGSYVAKIYKDKEGEKKLWKQDAALYSYMSLNIYGPGALDLNAENEGLGAEMHLTINGGEICIRSQDDGVNTNEDGVSVTTINAGSVHIIAGLGSEGDGIDSNGYLVINGGTVVSSAHPAADAGLDSDLGSFVNGGTVIALGSTMDWAESDSEQVTMNLQFAEYRSSDCAIVIKREDGGIVFAYDPGEDEVVGSNVRQFMGAVISSPNLKVGESYTVFMDGTVTGNDVGGVYETHTITTYEGGVQQMYTGTDVGFGFGGFGGMGGMPGDGEMPDGWTMPENGEMPEGRPMPENGEMPDGWTMPENGEMPDGWTMPENGEMPEGRPMPGNGEMPEDGRGPGTQQGGQTGDQPGNAIFYMNDKVNAFSGVTALEKGN